MQKLLFPSDHVPKAEKTDFIKAHFPEEWNTASKMTKQETDQMMNEWRAYFSL